MNEEEDRSQHRTGQQLLSSIVEQAEHRLGKGVLAPLWLATDTGARITLVRELEERLAQGWPELDLIDRLAGACNHGMWSPAAVLLQQVRTLEPLPPDLAHRSATRDEFPRRRAEQAARHGAVLARSISDHFELLDRLCAEYGEDGDILDAAFAGAGIDPLNPHSTAVAR